jgi:hypothetical protein
MRCSPNERARSVWYGVGRRCGNATRCCFHLRQCASGAMYGSVTRLSRQAECLSVRWWWTWMCSVSTSLNPRNESKYRDRLFFRQRGKWISCVT